MVERGWGRWLHGARLLPAFQVEAWEPGLSFPAAVGPGAPQPALPHAAFPDTPSLAGKRCLVGGDLLAALPGAARSVRSRVGEQARGAPVIAIFPGNENERARPLPLAAAGLGEGRGGPRSRARSVLASSVVGGPWAALAPRAMRGRFCGPRGAEGPLVLGRGPRQSNLAPVSCVFAAGSEGPSRCPPRPGASPWGGETLSACHLAGRAQTLALGATGRAGCCSPDPDLRVQSSADRLAPAQAPG